MGREREKAMSAGISGKTGTMAEEKKGTDVRRGCSGAAMIFAAKLMRKKTTREKGEVVCLAKRLGGFQCSFIVGLRDTFPRIQY